MYNFKMPIVHTYDADYNKRKKLLVEVLGYTEEELEQFSKTMYMCNVATNLTLEQLELVVKPFYDNDIHICITDCHGGHLSFPQAGINLAKEPPKDHYYDQPVVSRDQLVNPLTQKAIERQDNYARQEREDRIAKTTPVKVTCPYCKSTDCKKISGLSKAGSVALWGIFALGKTTKQFHCNNCKADF